MSTIRDLAYSYDADGTQRIKSPWRADLQPAAFGEAYFYVEANAVENGRRIVMHEFPKKNQPYAEDMGRKAFEFTVRGYCIQYPYDGVGNEGSQLKQRDYRVARDILSIALSSGDPLPLRLPTFKGAAYNEMLVYCPRYRLTEEDRSGGYCTFDMTFVELGAPPRQPQPDNRDEVIKYYQEMRDRNVDILTRGIAQSPPAAVAAGGNGGTDV